MKSSITLRHQFILEELGKNGIVHVQNLADRLGVTGATIRRDLRILEKKKVLQRGFGNAVPTKVKATDLPLNEKYSIRTFEKSRIGRLAATLVEENDSLMVTSGSTIEAFVRYFEPVQGGQRHTVVTPSIHLAAMLMKKPHARVRVLGGVISNDSLSVRGIEAIEALRHIHCDKLFLSCDGLDLRAGVTSAYMEEAQLTTAMMAAATTVILLADSSKIGKVGLGKTCDAGDIDILVTDEGISSHIKETLELQGVRVIIA